MRQTSFHFVKIYNDSVNNNNKLPNEDFICEKHSKTKDRNIYFHPLWKKKSSTFEPDFCPIKLDSDPWIVQPTEHYEELNIDEIIKRNK